MWRSHTTTNPFFARVGFPDTLKPPPQEGALCGYFLRRGRAAAASHRASAKNSAIGGQTRP